LNAGREIRVLATAFGAFPGVRFNPSFVLAQSLARFGASAAAGAGIRLETVVLPVVWRDAAPTLLAAIETFSPDVVLSIGVAARRRRPTVEARSLDRRSVLRPDAAKRLAGASRLRGSGDFIRRARVPAARLATAMSRAGAASAVSIDAGDYLCNETLDAALGTNVPVVGFVHVPRPRDLRAPIGRSGAGLGARRPTMAALTAALRAALVTLATELRNHRASSPVEGAA
jgi:pyroglutamyl-peptidase